MNPWRIFGIVLVAFVVGLVHDKVKPHIESVVPPEWRSAWYTQALFNGAFILLAVTISAFVLRIVGVKGAKVNG